MPTPVIGRPGRGGPRPAGPSGPARVVRVVASRVGRAGKVSVPALAVVLCAACGVAPPSPATPSEPTVTTSGSCAAAVGGLVDAVRRYVAAYETSAGGTESAPSADPAGAARALDAALAVARDAVAGGCPQRELVDRLARELAAVTAHGPVARAVLLRLTANLTGSVGSDPSVPAGPGDDLQRVLATAAPGAVVYLSEGEYRLPDSLVLLDAVTLAGKGRDRTLVTSVAADAAVLVMTAGLVGLRGLTLHREPGTAGSAVVAGASSAVSLEDVRVSGARPDADGRGGAGVDLTGAGADPERTTLEVTDSLLSDNGWAGIAVSAGHRVSIESSRFEENAECGICFLGTGDGSVQASRFTGNHVGVAVLGTSAPVVRGNRFSGGEVGIQVGGDARPTIDGNRIGQAKRAAVVYTDRATGVLRATVCTRVRVGIALARTALPTLIDNDCTIVRAP